MSGGSPYLKSTCSFSREETTNFSELTCQCQQCLTRSSTFAPLPTKFSISWKPCPWRSCDENSCERQQESPRARPEKPRQRFFVTCKQEEENFCTFFRCCHQSSPVTLFVLMRCDAPRSTASAQHEMRPRARQLTLLCASGGVLLCGEIRKTAGCAAWKLGLDATRRRASR